MPIYEYECKKCKKAFEALVRISAEEKPECPQCGSRHTERLLSVFAAGSAKGRSASFGPTGSS
jgi:putative FmdB family regulatory protein